MPQALDNDKLTDFGRRLRKLIGRAGFRSRGAFIKAMGTDPNTVYRWEIGENKPHPDALAQMSDILGVSVDEIMGREAMVARDDDGAAARVVVDAFIARMGDRITEAHKDRLRGHRWSLPVPVDEDIVSSVWARMVRDDATPPAPINPSAAVVIAKGLRVLPKPPPKKR